MPARAGPREASALCLPPGSRRDSAEALRAAPGAPPPLAAPPAQRVAQARQCGDRRFVLTRMPGPSAKALFPKLPPRALEAGFGSRIWGAPRVEPSSPKGLEAQGASAWSFVGLERGPAPFRPARAHPRLAPCRGAGAGSPGGAGLSGTGRVFSTWAPDLDPGREGLRGKVQVGGGRVDSLHPSYFPPPHIHTQATQTLGAGPRAWRTPRIRQCLPVPATSSTVEKGLPGSSSSRPTPLPQ